MEDYIIKFHLAYYNKCCAQMPSFLGVTIEKSPLDLWVYQEIIFDTKPDIIVETGTRFGGSALWFAGIFDLINKGQVITIDIEAAPNQLVNHPRIIKLRGNSVSETIFNQVKELVGNRTVMVSLDSDHDKSHVIKEMELYSQLVSIGNYMVVEDTNIHSHPVRPDYGEGPMEAVKEFLQSRNDFVVDRSREKFLITFFPEGFLKRIK